MKNPLTAFGTATQWAMLAGLAVLAWSALDTRANAQQYKVTNLGTLDGGSSTASSSSGTAINGSGQVTGASTAGSAGMHAFLYSNGSMIDLGTLGGRNSAGFGINASGQVTGRSEATAPPFPAIAAFHAFLYSNGSMIDLGIPASDATNTFNQGFAINDRGQVTGDAVTTANPAVHAFLYSNGSVSDLDLGTLGVGGSAAQGINASGEITGSAAAADGTGHLHAFLYSNGSAIDLGTLGGDNSAGYGINAGGQVTGGSEMPAPPFPALPANHAFLYSNGSMIDLGTLGGASSVGFGINARGQVTGEADTAGGRSVAFLYSNGQMVDLNTEIGSAASLYTLKAGYAINDSGQIVVDGTVNATGQGVAFLLTPMTPSGL